MHISGFFQRCGKEVFRWIHPERLNRNRVSFVVRIFIYEPSKGNIIIKESADSKIRVRKNNRRKSPRSGSSGIGEPIEKHEKTYSDHSLLYLVGGHGCGRNYKNTAEKRGSGFAL